VRGVTQPFVYAGRLAYVEHDPKSSNPVKFAFSTPDIEEPLKTPLRALVAWKPTGTRAAGVPTGLVETAKRKETENADRAKKSSSRGQGMAGVPNTLSDADERKEREEEAEKTRQNSANTNGQGFEPDPLVRAAIELWAMVRAQRIYEKHGYRVLDVSKHQPFDLLCEKVNKKSRRVEVKGTRGDGSTIILTGNEVRSALDANAITDLVICHGIEVDYTGDRPRAHSGRTHVIQNWRPDVSLLQPTEYRYSVPPKK